MSPKGNGQKIEAYRAGTMSKLKASFSAAC
jgi:hypothetical protein